ncbi:ABC transporter ATP-binding protein [Lederbergia ruris]|uniref:ABC transporter ATP-binding protein n=1 Tax=Lederbergia ruris TaxID=217495 RepID=A0ABQ4KM93_9BACI|nr:ABC transporter ATP-binding protein [Lederbergia ruris]GIN59046.1 ABC transporter ATP-binding protein [Lederbergia ruris]
MEFVIEAKNLSKTYSIGKDNKQTVLKDVNLQINKGEFVSIMGPSGSGKSTLLYTISGMDRMTTGSVVFQGKELSSLSEKELSSIRLHNMGFIFQHVHLLKNLNMFDNIILSAYLAKKRSHKKINEHALALMKQTGITEISKHDMTQVSGGQLQRVGICRALINNPDILFGDEPTGALNSKAASEIMELLTDINHAGTAILIVTHDVKVAAKTERVLYMYDGVMIGEKRLGKYAGDDKQREERLSNWLMEMDF